VAPPPFFISGRGHLLHSHLNDDDDDDDNYDDNYNNNDNDNDNDNYNDNDNDNDNDEGCNKMSPLPYLRRKGGGPHTTPPL